MSVFSSNGFFHCVTHAVGVRARSYFVFPNKIMLFKIFVSLQPVLVGYENHYKNYNKGLHRA